MASSILRHGRVDHHAGRHRGTDHLSFDSIGLPGFQFIQDQIEYDTRTHHSSMDVYERIQADDAKQASIIMATFVYQAAMRDEKLPANHSMAKSSRLPQHLHPPRLNQRLLPVVSKRS